MVPDIAAFLDKATWLDGHRHLVSLLLKHGSQRRLGKGQWTHSEGDDDSGLLAVIEGALDLYCQAPGDRTVLAHRVFSGAVMGQTTRFGGGPRLVSAFAAQASVVFSVSDEALARIGQADPRIWELMASILYNQLGANIRRNAQLISLPPRQLIAARLLTLANNRETELAINQSELAEMLGLSRKAVNEHLGFMQRSDMIERKYGSVVIRSSTELKKLAAAAT